LYSSAAAMSARPNWRACAEVSGVSGWTAPAAITLSLTSPVGD
jgi:hypothetical protein